MKDLLNMAGLTKQALWKAQKREVGKAIIVDQTLRIIRNIRQRHKRMGCRSIYAASQMKPPVGRDNFIAIGMAHGFRLKRRRNKVKTTWSQRVEIFPNQIEGRILNGINQVWQSDIFYYEEQGVDYYGVTIVDVYSRRLLALHLSKSLRAAENVKALRKALRCRSKYNLVGCIFHSDRGSQYISEPHKTLLDQYGMKKSMCLLPQENAYAERIHDTIKNYYMCDEQLSGQDLSKIANRIMRKYNYEKPHSELCMRTPVAFENYVEKMIPRRRPKTVIFKWNHELSTKNRLLTKRKK